jgi:hypothetical protein
MCHSAGSSTSTAKAAENEIEINAQKHMEGSQTLYMRKSRGCKTPNRMMPRDVSAVLI